MLVTDLWCGLLTTDDESYSVISLGVLSPMSLPDPKNHTVTASWQLPKDDASSKNPESHIKQIPSAQLRPGMYICDFNAGWMSHPFLFTKLHVRTEAEIAEIRRYGIDSVFIDTQRGLDLEDAPTLGQVVSESRSGMLDQAQAQPKPARKTESLPRAPTAEDLRRARQILNQTAERLGEALGNARLGKSIDIPALYESVQEISAAVIRNSSAMALICQLRQRDEYTFNHSLNVGVLLAHFSHHLGHDQERMHQISLGGILHDIGKMQVESRILNKPGKLTDGEYAEMKTHVQRGLHLISAYPLAEATRQVIAEHHERYDGHGYPRAMTAEAISEAGRMAAIVDVYDAVSSRRVYHQALPPAEAMRRIFEWQQHFDRSMVTQFVRCIGIYPIGSLVRLKSHRLAIVIRHHPEKLMRPRIRIIFDTRNNAYLPPSEIDLAAKHWEEREAIVGHEDPERWGIDIAQHVGA